MGQISLIIMLAIALCFTPIVFWIVWRGGKFGHQKWEEHKNEVDARYYAPRNEQRRLEQIPDPQQMSQRGRYDMEIEELLQAQQYGTARDLCIRHLRKEGLEEQQREMYDRYVRVIDEQLL